MRPTLGDVPVKSNRLRRRPLREISPTNIVLFLRESKTITTKMATVGQVDGACAVRRVAKPACLPPSPHRSAIWHDLFDNVILLNYFREYVAHSSPVEFVFIVNSRAAMKLALAAAACNEC